MPVWDVKPHQVELAFLLRLSAADDITPVLKMGMTQDWFTDPAMAHAFVKQMEHVAVHGRPASRGFYSAMALMGEHSTPVPTDDLATTVEAVRRSTAIHLADKAVQRAQSELGNPDVPEIEAYDRLVGALDDARLVRLMRGTQAPEGLDDAKGIVLAALHEGPKNRIPTPWQAFNETLGGGLAGGDFVVIAGPQKSGKSDVLIELGVHAAKDLGRKVLLISNEMSKEDIQRRVVARWAEVDYRIVRNVNRPPVQTAEMDHKIKAALAGPRVGDVWCLHLSSFGAAAVAEALASVRILEPDLLLWDSNHLSAASTKWEDIYDTAHKTRALALTETIPVAVTVQYREDKGAITHKAYHDDCTASFHIVREAGDPATIKAKTMDVREGEEASWAMRHRRGLPMLYQVWSGVMPTTKKAASGAVTHAMTASQETVPYVTPGPQGGWKPHNPNEGT